MMNNSQFMRNYMEFVTRIGEIADRKYMRFSNDFYNDRVRARLDALFDSVVNAVDIAFHCDSDYFMQQAIQHADYMYSVYEDTDNVADATYYIHYPLNMKKFRKIYLQCMTY